MKFDAIVIGSGQGRNSRAFGLADKGWNESVRLLDRLHMNDATRGIQAPRDLYMLS